MSILYDPDGHLDAAIGLPLDRTTHLRLAHAIISAAADGSPGLADRDYEQIALQLTGHARLVAREVRGHCDRLPSHADPRVLAELVLDEVDRRLALPLLGTVRCAASRARLVRALYERLDRLESAIASPTSVS
ncbi:hypothetical protein GCM10010211_10590 [Streptomyces albospinus]|uniref:Restriction endonuclease n=1 Tax=Streptomyces albospinus TaxID=285515 RepID=A0ABQ2UQ41_9ACTN|nr:restriction endonuclease [Streptomyces albospinus]GGU48262.1 hypothetical protein GCM10010211_10590 [Streptomyces albospinus]